jgi:sulfur relay (sulfurtransferase) DsrC/TusE family protein
VGRKLPAPISRLKGETDEEFAAREQFSKRRLQIFKRVYQHYYHWRSLRETGEVGDVIVVEGVDYYLGDLLVGLPTLPAQQRKAFELICLHGYTENAATDIVLPKSKWSTPVQQYSDDGLRKMVAAYDAKQAGTWDPVAAKQKRRRKKEDVMTASEATPEVPVETPESAPEASAQPVADTETKHKSRAQYWDWTKWSEDHESLAKYINDATGLGITPAHVKAVSFLRKEWYHSPAQVQARQRRADERKAAEAKYAYETPEQRQARFAALRVSKQQEAATRKAQELADQIKDLRIQAGLDPETGEPVAVAS